jgi:hypothetical protein
MKFLSTASIFEVIQMLPQYVTVMSWSVIEIVLIATDKLETNVNRFFYNSCWLKSVEM